MPQKVCLNCQKGFYICASQLKAYKGGGKFCSRNCHWTFYRNNPDQHPLFKAEGFLESNGYKRIGRNREHRLVMEKYLNRKLQKGEVVHHKNHNKSDNRLENLEVLSASEHHRKHAYDEGTIRGLKKAQEVSRKLNEEWKQGNHWSKKWDVCQQCFRKDSKHQGNGLCSKCYLAAYQSKIKCSN